MQCDASVLYAVYDGNTPIRAVVRVFFLTLYHKTTIKQSVFRLQKKTLWTYNICNKLIIASLRLYYDDGTLSVIFHSNGDSI